MHAVLPPDQVLARDCPPGHLPVLRQCLNPRAAVLYYHWGCNPFGANRRCCRSCRAAPSSNGWCAPTALWTSPPAPPANYGPVHRITRERFDELAVHGVTRYCVIDPATPRTGL